MGYYDSMSKILNSPDGAAAKMFSEKEAPLIRKLEDWMGVKHTYEFKSLNDLRDFFVQAGILLDDLTPKE